MRVINNLERGKLKNGQTASKKPTTSIVKKGSPLQAEAHTKKKKHPGINNSIQKNKNKLRQSCAKLRQAKKLAAFDSN